MKAENRGNLIYVFYELLLYIYYNVKEDLMYSYLQIILQHVLDLEQINKLLKWFLVPFRDTSDSVKVIIDPEFISHFLIFCSLQIAYLVVK